MFLWVCWPINNNYSYGERWTFYEPFRELKWFVLSWSQLTVVLFFLIQGHLIWQTWKSDDMYWQKLQQYLYHWHIHQRNSQFFYWLYWSFSTQSTMVWHRTLNQLLLEPLNTIGPLLLINITSSGHSELNMYQLSRTAEGWKKMCDF